MILWLKKRNKLLLCINVCDNILNWVVKKILQSSRLIYWYRVIIVGHAILYQKANVFYDPVCFYILKVFLKKIEFYLFLSLLQINIFLIFSDHFDVLISKIILKN